MVRSMFWPTLRVAHPVPIAVTVVLGSIPLAVTIVRNGDDLVTPLVVFGIVAGAAIGWIADDPIAELAAPCPVNAPRRISYRAALAGCTVVIVGALAVAVATVDGARASDWNDRIPELAAAAAIALAAGLLISRRGDPLAGATGVAVGALLPPIVAALAFRWPAAFPSFQASPSHARWWLVAVAAGTAAVHQSLDVARRRSIRPTASEAS